MKIAKFNIYQDGANTTCEISLPDHTTVTGNEDHFALSWHDAKMIAAGLRLAFPCATVSIVSIDLRA